MTKQLTQHWMEVLTKRQNEEAHWDDGFDVGSAYTVSTNVETH